MPLNRSQSPSARSQRDYRIPPSHSHNALQAPAQPTSSRSRSRSRSRTLSGPCASSANTASHTFRIKAPSGSSALNRPQYRYSIGPAPVSFPRTERGAAGAQATSPGPSTPSSSLRSPFRWASQREGQPNAESSRARSSKRRSPSSPQSALFSDSTSIPGVQTTAGGASPTNKPPRTSSSRPTNTSKNSGLATGEESQTALVARHALPRRRSSRILTLTSFPFPHPTTPKGTIKEETNLSSVVTVPQGMRDGFHRIFSRWAGSRDETRDETRDDVNGGNGQYCGRDQTPSRRRVDETSRLLDRTGSGRQGQPETTAHPREVYGSEQVTHAQASRHGSMRTTYSIATIVSDESDSTDPYGYRRMAGPELLPAYHEEHVNPRRRARKTWTRRIGSLWNTSRNQGSSTPFTITTTGADFSRQRRGTLVVGAVALGFLIASLVGLSWYWFFWLFWLGNHSQDGL